MRGWPKKTQCPPRPDRPLVLRVANSRSKQKDPWPSRRIHMRWNGTMAEYTPGPDTSFQAEHSTIVTYANAKLAVS